jgi:hypothetical protein
LLSQSGNFPPFLENAVAEPFTLDFTSATQQLRINEFRKLIKDWALIR